MTPTEERSIKRAINTINERLDIMEDRIDTLFAAQAAKTKKSKKSNNEE